MFNKQVIENQTNRLIRVAAVVGGINGYDDRQKTF